jgi:hypothetical protein
MFCSSKSVFSLRLSFKSRMMRQLSETPDILVGLSSSNLEPIPVTILCSVRTDPQLKQIEVRFSDTVASQAVYEVVNVGKRRDQTRVSQG